MTHSVIGKERLMGLSKTRYSARYSDSLTEKVTLMVIEKGLSKDSHLGLERATLREILTVKDSPKDFDSVRLRVILTDSLMGFYSERLRVRAKLTDFERG